LLNVFLLLIETLLPALDVKITLFKVIPVVSSERFIDEMYVQSSVDVPGLIIELVPVRKTVKPRAVTIEEPKLSVTAEPIPSKVKA
jgi:hypothetical protein